MDNTNTITMMTFQVFLGNQADGFCALALKGTMKICSDTGKNGRD